MRIVVGAPDGEMRQIEHLARRAGCKVAWATINGRLRVSPITAYQARHPKPLPGDVWVECRPAGAPRVEIAYCDHHIEGDPGVSTPPERFLGGSSLGQVIRILAAADAYPGERIPFPTGTSVEPGSFWFDGDIWWVATPSGAVTVEVEHVLTAAGDHCLAAAYAGHCPGVDPDALWTWRTDAIPEGMDHLLDAEEQARSGRPFTFRTLQGMCMKGDPTGEAVEEFLLAAERRGFQTYGSPERGFGGYHHTIENG